MGEKKNNEGAENKKKADEGEKKKKGNESVTVVLKVDMHCEGCASRIVKCLRGFEGVESVKSEAAAGKLTVTGTVDPAKLREKLQAKTKKKVEVVSPQPKKDKENAKDKDSNNTNKNEGDDKNKAKKSDDKKPDNDKKPKDKEPPVTTAVLKLNFHCQGCIGKIQKTVTKTKGVDMISMDREKQLVTVKGTMDVKKLSEALSEKLRRAVEIVPPAKEKEKEKEKNKDNGKDNDGGKKKKGNEEGANKMEHVAAQPESGFGYGYGFYQYPIQAHAPQIFSDENPNACAVM